MAEAFQETTYEKTKKKDKGSMKKGSGRGMIHLKNSER